MRTTAGTFLVLVVIGAAPALAGPGDADSSHWSFRPRSQAPIPRFAEPRQSSWVRSPVDAFVLDKLRGEGLGPTREADRRTLIRRLTFDLLGLPPTPAEAAAFEADPAPDAYERLVERLLASPHYGERWGRHWLDVVRFGESEGFEYDRHLPGAWRFRDYVIRSFNDDMPYDQFVREQLAGDELAGGTEEGQVAVGFHRLGPVRRNAGNQKVAFSRNEVLTERTDIVGAVFLGLTVGCARCHDHKFDEIPQADYYRLQAYLAASQENDVTLADKATQDAWKARTEKATAEIQKLRQAQQKATGEAKSKLQARINEAVERMPPPLAVITSVRNEEKERTPIFVLKRGDGSKPGKRVGPRPLSALVPENTPELPASDTAPRTRLAAWITRPDHPLTARVLVNRVWQYHFGRGIVETPNDFGVNGGTPSHPELLDYLANFFLANGQRWKPLHRLILLSNTYRQASRAVPAAESIAKDPDNRLLSSFPRRRLEAEEIRDALLAVSGRLNRKAGGPSLIVPLDEDLVHLLYNPTQWAVTKDRAEHDRRSIYLIAKRNLRVPFVEVFDQPDMLTSCARRESSTHALQALEMLNGDLSNHLAKAFADRLAREAGPDPSRQVELAYRLAAGRPPTEAEKTVATKFLAKQPLREFALAVFSLNGFLYVD